jgi:hypothetical protein
MGIKYYNKLKNEQFLENKAVSSSSRMLRLKKNITTYPMKKPKAPDSEEFALVTMNPYNLNLPTKFCSSDYIAHTEEYYDENNTYVMNTTHEFIRANLFIPSVQFEIIKNRNSYAPGTIEGSRNTFNRFHSLCPVDKFLDDFDEVVIEDDVSEPETITEPEPETTTVSVLPDLSEEIVLQIVASVPIISQDNIQDDGTIQIDVVEDVTIYENTNDQQKSQIRKAVVENLLEQLDDTLDPNQGQILILGREALAIDDVNVPSKLQVIVPLVISQPSQPEPEPEPETQPEPQPETQPETQPEPIVIPTPPQETKIPENSTVVFDMSSIGSSPDTGIYSIINTNEVITFVTSQSKITVSIEQVGFNITEQKTEYRVTHYNRDGSVLSGPDTRYTGYTGNLDLFSYTLGSIIGYNIQPDDVQLVNIVESLYNNASFYIDNLLLQLLDGNYAYVEQELAAERYNDLSTALANEKNDTYYYYEKTRETIVHTLQQVKYSRTIETDLQNEINTLRAQIQLLTTQNKAGPVFSTTTDIDIIGQIREEYQMYHKLYGIPTNLAYDPDLLAKIIEDLS